MKNRMLTFAAISFLLTIFCLQACNQSAETKPETKEDLVSRGKYLVGLMGCNDCHTSKIMTPHGPMLDTAHLLAGYLTSEPVGPYDSTVLKSWVLFNFSTTATVGPWGTTFSANLTSDESGIGSWSEAQFFKALREGKSKGLDGGRMIMPPMPWQSIGKATDADLKAIFEYLKSTKPVRNVVPQPIHPGHA